VAITHSIIPTSPPMSSYLDYPRLHDIAAQLYADQLSEDQRFRLQNELDDAAVTNILGDCILAPQFTPPLIPQLQLCWDNFPTSPKSLMGRLGATITSKRRRE